MELKDILAISGQPGLYKFVAQSMRGIIVESLLDGKRMNASATSRVSALTEISMFTEGEDIALADVFTNIWNYTGGKEAISHKEADNAIREEFAKQVCICLTTAEETSSAMLLKTERLTSEHSNSSAQVHSETRPKKLRWIRMHVTHRL